MKRIVSTALELISNALLHLKRRVRPSRENQVMTTKETVRPRKILIVEDDELVRKMLKLYIQGLRAFEFWEEENGKGALNLARRIQPDIIVTDLNMPIMDGVEFTKEIRRDAELSHIPVIVITGTDESSKNLAYEAGADLVLSKPLSHGVMTTALNKFLPK